jgi:predicted branched-subunit amino acid permease
MQSWIFWRRTDTTRGMTTDARESDTTFTVAGVLHGARAGQAIALSVALYGVVFGILATQAKLAFAEAAAMSAVVYSGTAQLAAVTAMTAGPVTAGALAATILVMNARYVLYSAALRPWLGGASALQAYATLFLLGDGNWMLAMKAHADGERDAGFIFGSGLVMFAAWMAGTAFGCLAGGAVPNPRALGLDFMLPAFAAAMLIGMVKSKREFGPAIAGAGAAIAIQPIASFGWATVAAGLAGGVAAAAMWRKEA